MFLKVFYLLLLSATCCLSSFVIYTQDGDSSLSIEIVENGGLSLNLLHRHEIKLSGHIGKNVKIVEPDCNLISCIFLGSDGTNLTIKGDFETFNIVWRNTKNDKTVFTDCYDLNSTNVSWYGGPEVLTTAWPIEKLTLKNRPFIASKLDNGAVIEPYWLNSKGGFIWIEKHVPLFVDQNNEKKDAVCFRSEVKAPFGCDSSNLTYTIMAEQNAKNAHLYATSHLIRRTSGIPHVRMIREPIWTTWGKYKANIDDKSVIDYLTNIYNHNFTKGQIEIDDKWEACYGDQSFDVNSRFKNIKETVETIHNLGFRATLWTHPFVNTDCEFPVEIGKLNGYFVNSSVDPVTSWWEGDKTYVIDFTNKNAAQWFLERLLKIQEDIGIDGFKCDAGESDWLPEEPIYQKLNQTGPNGFTYDYLSTCGQLGKLVEVRSGAGTQHLPVFVRMLDKDSVWGENNGLRALVHSLLQFNMIGYTMVLPDLVGGNGYNGTQPTPELLVRWTQANAFMPAIQFSFLPWELEEASFNATEIVKKFVDLHEEYSDLIIDAMINSEYGTPTNPPIWWVDPTDPIALKVDDEFLVGQRILVAPVLEEGAVSRDIYLPNGRWRDGNNGTIYEGRQTLKNYSAPIDILPYFQRLS